MDLRNARNGDWIALASGVALIVALFLPWYDTGEETLNAWQELTVIDFILLGCALFGVAQFFFTVQQATPAMPLAVAGLGAWTGVLAVALTLIRVVDAPADGLEVQFGAFIALAASAGGGARPRRPPRAAGPPADGLEVQFGAFIALAASAGLFTGAWRALGDERIRMPDGRWSRPAAGEIGAGVEVKTLRPPRADTGNSE